MLRVRGIHDELTPVIFAETLANVFSELRYRGNDKIDFDSYFLNALDESAKAILAKTKAGEHSASDEPVQVAAKCVSILDPKAQQLLYAKVAGQYSYERIRDEFNFSNSVIAQYEVTKVMDQLEGIVKLRMNFSSIQHG